MARDRLILQEELRKFARKAYFKRPPDDKLVYPCIIYRPSKPATRYADNKVYTYMPCYNVVYISEMPDETIERRMLEHFEYCSSDREYESDGLYHYSFTLFW